MNWFKKILKKIQNSARRRSLIAATKEANKICLETGKTMLIYFYKGEFRYIAKQDAKKPEFLIGSRKLSGEKCEAIANAKIVRFMKPKEKALETAVKDKKLSPEDVKKLQIETTKKLGKIVVK